MYKNYLDLRDTYQDAAAKLGILKADPDAILDVRDGFRIPGDVSVAGGLVQAVKAGLGSGEREQGSDSEGEGLDLSTTIRGFNGLIACSELLWQRKLGSTAVIGLNSDIVMKVDRKISIDYFHPRVYQAASTTLPNTSRTWCPTTA